MVGEVLSLVDIMSVASLHHREELRYSLYCNGWDKPFRKVELGSGSRVCPLCGC